MQAGIRDLIHLWKFQHQPQLSPLLASLFIREAFTPADLPRSLVLIPIPTQWRRQLQRGFDHTRVLAQAIAATYPHSLTVKPWLRHTRSGATQHRLNRSARWHNQHERFAVNARIQGCQVVLLDDVMTTGATVNAAAAACLKAGAKQVKVWCFARTPEPGLTRLRGTMAVCVMGKPIMNHPYESLTPDNVISCVESIGLLGDLRILALNSYENRVYQFGLEDAEPVIAKFYRPGRWTRAQIQEEHDFTQELTAAELSVVAPMSINGQTLHEAGGYLIAIFPRRGGHAPELDNADHLLGLGRTLGRMHGVGRAKGFDERIDYSLQRWLVEPIHYLAENWIPDELQPAWNTLGKDLIERASALMSDYDPQQGIRLHGDCHVGNILWRDETPHFVDLDDCVTGPAYARSVDVFIRRPQPT
jgi:ComF family protein